MKRVKVIGSIILSIILLFPINLAYAQGEGRVVGLDENVEAYLIGNEESGEIYYEKNADDSRAIASLTKLMTYLLTQEAIDNGEITLDTKFKADEETEKLTSWEYSALGLEEGEEYTVEELIQGLLVVSGNDCAYLLAKSLAGSEEKFAQKMNDKANELGLASQRYYNASGIETEDGKENTSSARDLFKLAQYIRKTYPDISKYTTMDEVSLPDKGISEPSTIPLRDDIGGVDGLKTGTTDKAGYCLITTVDMAGVDPSDNFRCIGVVMGADQKDTRDSVMSDLIYYISRYYSYKDVLSTNESVKSLDLISAKQGYVDLYPDQNITIVSKDDKIVSKKVSINENIQAPIKKGDVLGKVYVTYDDESYEVNLVAQNDVAQASTFGKIFRTIGNSVNFMIDLLIAR